MLLSFSVPEMLPYIRAGVIQAKGGQVGNARVKRQTIRGLGPRNAELLKHDPIAHTIPYRVHLWWKSRTKDREFLGVFEPEHVRVYPITILHASMQSPGGPIEQCIKVEAAAWDRRNSCYFWPDSATSFSDFAYADGFDSPEAFRDYFVPNLGDRFNGVLFKW